MTSTLNCMIIFAIFIPSVLFAPAYMSVLSFVFFLVDLPYLLTLSFCALCFGQQISTTVVQGPQLALYAYCVNDIY